MPREVGCTNSLMLRSFECLQLFEGGSNGLEIESCSQGEVLESVLAPQALQTRRRIQGHKTVIALGAYSPRRRLG